VKLCKWCDNYFQPTVSYQIYCSPECREKATKEKIIERHKVLRRQKRIGKERRCAGQCGTILSIYNDGKYCEHCLVDIKQVEKRLKEIKGLMNEDK
jgi:DNA-binding FrmR family transcriptional regulator